MAYNPELVKNLLGKQVAELFDGTVEVIPSDGSTVGNLKVGDTLIFKLKEKADFQPHQFIVTVGK